MVVEINDFRLELHSWIVCQIKVGGGNKCGGNFSPQKCKFWYFLPYFFPILSPKFANFAIFLQKMLILTIFSQKSAILKNFPLLKVKNMGKVFHNFFANKGKTYFFGRIFTNVELQWLHSYMLQINPSEYLDNRWWQFCGVCVWTQFSSYRLLKVEKNKALYILGLITPIYTAPSFQKIMRTYL